MRNQKDAFIFSRVLYTGVILIPVLYYSFITKVLNSDRRRQIFLFYVLSLVFLWTLWFTRRFLEGNILYKWGYSSDAAWGHHVYLVYFSSVFLTSFYELYRGYNYWKNRDSNKANQIKYLLSAFIIATFASADFASTYGFSFYPPGFLFMTLFAAITLYAIIKHRLLDINLVVKNGALYTASLSVISIMYVFLIIGSERIAQLYLGHSSPLFAFATTLAISIFFIPLHNMLNGLLSKVFFRASPLELAETNMKLMQEVERKDRLKAIATLAAGLAHEVRNPLTAIKTFTEHLPQKSGDPQFIGRFTEVVGSEINKIDSLVKQLLEFSKPSPLTIEKIHLRQIMDETLDLLNSEFVKHGIKVERNYPADSPFIGDKKQLKQAFLNLFLNGIQAMPDGGVLTVSILMNGNRRLKVSISDTGVGIPKENIPRLFDPFFTTKPNGTGLGLSIVHGIIKGHGGKIEVSSQPRFGTTFTLSFK